MSPFFFLDFHFYYFDLSVALGAQPNYCKAPIKSGYMRGFVNLSDPAPAPLNVISKYPAFCKAARLVSFLIIDVSYSGGDFGRGHLPSSGWKGDLGNHIKPICIVFF